MRLAHPGGANQDDVLALDKGQTGELVDLAPCDASAKS